MLEEDIRRRHPEFKVDARGHLFELALEHADYRSLLRCFQGSAGVAKKDAKKASYVLSETYKSLSRKIQGEKSAEDYQQSDDKVDIDAGALSLPAWAKLCSRAPKDALPVASLTQQSPRVSPRWGV